MILFLLAYALVGLYALAYIRFSMKKSGFAAGLAVLVPLLLSAGSMALVLYYRIHT